MLDLKRAFGPTTSHTEYQPQDNSFDPVDLQANQLQEQADFGGYTPADNSNAAQNPPQPASTAPQPQPSYQPQSSAQPTPPFQPTRDQQPPQQPTNRPEPDLDTNFAGIPKPQPEETVLTWSSPSRPFKRRNRQFYTTVGIIVFLVSIILFFAGQFLPIAVVISVAFLAYVLSSVPPHEAVYKITTYGIRIEDQLYYWEELGRFWFDEKYHQKMVNIEVSRFPGRLTLMLGELSEAEIADILQEVLIQQKPAETFFDTSAKWLQEKIPLDNT